MTSRAVGAPIEPATAPRGRAAVRREPRRARSRWLVHIALLSAAGASLGTLQLLHVRTAYHTVVGLVFVGLVLVHLAQRRRTLARMAAHLVRATTHLERRIRLTVSDLVLGLLTLNVLVSGLVDWNRGSPVQLPLPKPFYRWHLDAGILLVGYLVVHVSRRRKRLRRSTIR